MALIDIDYFKGQPFGGKGLDLALPSEVLTETLQEASDYIEDYLDRKIQLTNYVERILGKRTYTLILDNYPITEVNDISYVDTIGNPGTHDLSDFLIHGERGVIEKIDKRDWFRGDRVYIVTYTAGYVSVPTPIKKATALQTVQLLRPAYGGPSDTAGEIVPFADELIISLLEKYRRKRLS